MRNEERAAMRAGMAQEQDTGVLDLPEAEKKEFKFKSFFASGEKGIKKFGVRNLVIVLSVLLIGVAVYVNWALFGGSAEPDDDLNAGLPGETDDVTPSGNEEETRLLRCFKES